MSPQEMEARRGHWLRTRILAVAALLALAVLVFVVPWLGPDLDRFALLGFPLGFIMAAQGSLVAFVVILLHHNWHQDRIDDRYGLGDE